MLIIVTLFGLMMCVSVVWLMVALATAKDMTEASLFRGTAIFEVVDALLVLAGIALISRCDFPNQDATVRVLTWTVSVPIFGFMLILNVLYMSFWRSVLGVDTPPTGPPLTAVVIVLFCLQPAIVEEVFFRYLVMGVLRARTGMHAAVWITAIMFALMHIANPLGMPYLFLVGAFLGYTRVWGGMALPMILHFFHNFAVLAMAN